MKRSVEELNDRVIALKRQLRMAQPKLRKWIEIEIDLTLREIAAVKEGDNEQ